MCSVIYRRCHRIFNLTNYINESFVRLTGVCIYTSNMVCDVFSVVLFDIVRDNCNYIAAAGSLIDRRTS